MYENAALVERMEKMQRTHTEELKKMQENFAEQGTLLANARQSVEELIDENELMEAADAQLRQRLWEMENELWDLVRTTNFQNLRNIGEQTNNILRQRGVYIPRYARTTTTVTTIEESSTEYEELDETEPEDAEM